MNCCINERCFHNISSPTGVVVSPNYPHSYPNEQRCSWLFNSFPGQKIKLIFTDFELEAEEDCEYDHVVVYDGDSYEARVLGRFCGIEIPQNILSTGNKLLMIFESDYAFNGRGFKLTHSNGNNILMHFT